METFWLIYAIAGVMVSALAYSEAVEIEHDFIYIPKLRQAAFLTLTALIWPVAVLYAITGEK